MLLVLLSAAIRRFFTVPSRLLEPASGLATFGWGGLLLIGQEPAKASGWPSVELFFRLHDGPFWGWVAIIIGLGQLAVFRAIDGDWERPWVRCGAAGVAAWLWGAITISMVQYSAVLPPGAAAYFTFWAANVYLMFRSFSFWGRV